MTKFYIFLLGLLVLGSVTGVRAQTLHIDGTEREYIVHVPQDLPADNPVPLIIALHPLGNNNTTFETMTRFSVLADQEGFIVAYPQGIGNSWNVGVCCSPAMDQDVDDIAFISLLIDTLIGSYPVDTGSVYLAGFSNGALLAYTLASEISDKIDGIAAVGGLLAQDENHASHAMPIIHIHALYDGAVHFDGEFGFPGVDSLLNNWRAINGIVAEPDTFRNDGGVKGILHRSPDNKSNILLYTSETGDHAWTISSRLGTTKRIWEFFTTGVNKPYILEDTIPEGPRQRDYLIHVPSGYIQSVDENSRYPLIVAAHGWDQNAQYMEELTGFSTLADSKGFFVTYLHYVGPPPDTSWNYFMEEGKPDDIGYAKAVIDTLFARFPIDSNKVYGVGFSDGCGLTDRLPFETNGLVSAIGTVAGMITFDPEVTTSPVRMIHFHARNDPYVNYGNVRNTNLNYWLEVDDCENTPDTLLNVAGYQAEVFTNAAGDSSILFYTLPWSYHDWPVNDGNSMKLSASKLMWKFFDTGMAIADISENPPESLHGTQAGTSLLLYPNPASDQIHLQCDLCMDDKLLIRLYQTDGREIYSCRREVRAGRQVLTLPLPIRVQGYYLLSVEGNALRKTVSFTIR